MLMFLLVVPVITVAIIMISCIVSAIMHKNKRYTSYTPAVIPEDPPRPVEVIRKQEYPDIADQFDGRLTNIVRNPMKGIL